MLIDGDERDIDHDVENIDPNRAKTYKCKGLALSDSLNIAPY